MEDGQAVIEVVSRCLYFPGDSVGKESICNAGDLGWEDPLEKGKATHSSILAWRTPWTVESTGSQRETTERLLLSLSLAAASVLQRKYIITSSFS